MTALPPDRERARRFASSYTQTEKYTSAAASARSTTLRNLVVNRRDRGRADISPNLADQRLMGWTSYLFGKSCGGLMVAEFKDSGHVSHGIRQRRIC